MVSELSHCRGDLTPVPYCNLLFPDETMRLEDPVMLTDRDDDLDREM